MLLLLQRHLPGHCTPRRGKAGLFDRETALAFRRNILETGGTEDPMTLYVRFRGHEPKIDALLEGRGLN